MKKQFEIYKQNILSGKYKKNRLQVDLEFSKEELANSNMHQWMTERFRKSCAMEKTKILPDEKIIFTRTNQYKVPQQPDIALNKKINRYTGHNMCADWGKSISLGLLKQKDNAVNALKNENCDKESRFFLKCAIDSIDIALELAGRYAIEARKMGRDDIYELLSTVPAKPAKTLHQALQSLKFLHSCAWLTGSSHIGLGRFDQYIYPYYKNDIKNGVISQEEADDLITEFFISLNKDIDTYPGMQQGDNGQSIMLGGIKQDGSSAINELTWKLLEISREVNMIDPKINLRIDKNTDLELLKEASKLTAKGLGFPQYSNDDVVIPALVKHGYKIEDARDYVVAACWEFIIPGKGMDIPNITALSFPAEVDCAIRELKHNDDYKTLENRIKENIQRRVEKYISEWHFDENCPNPFYSVLMTDCIKKRKDIGCGGGSYYNFGIHGAGSSNAADALAVVKKFVFEEKKITITELIKACDNNWEGCENLRHQILNSELKVGNNCKYVDDLLKKLFDWFADACESIKDNGIGGCVRPGTGSAMFYVLLTDMNYNALPPTVGATVDGRKVGDFLSSSLAPSPGIRVDGPISTLQSFSVLDYDRIYNGGPITLEMANSVFSNDKSLEKVAIFIQMFIKLGCQQLQMNVLNPKMLLDAQAHPEKYRNLIVRVWGWSGYFTELATEYQEHIISRHIHSC